MTKYIAEFALDSDIRLPDDTDEIQWSDKDVPFDLTLRNRVKGFLRTSEALVAELVFDAEGVMEAKEKCQDLLATILSSLVWTTLSMIRQAKLLRVVDWSPGKTMREALVLHTTQKIVVSQPILLNEFVESAAKVYSSQQDSDTLTALRWFRLGIGADTLEEQFSYFWFALETAAEKLKSAGKVPTACPVCQAALFCEACGTHPEHRRFSADAIRDLILGSFKEEERARQAFQVLTKIRHTLLHGRRIHSISAKLPYSEEDATNQLMGIARNAILKMSDFSKYQGELKLSIVQSADVTRGQVSAAAHVELWGGANPDKPDLASIGNLKVDIQYPGESEQG